MTDCGEAVLQSLDQKRAAFAWKKMHDDHVAGDEAYTRVAKGAPALLAGSGLMQLLAFLQAKGDKHEKLAKHLREWLARGEWASETSKPGADWEYKPFMDYLHEKVTAAMYRRMTEEAMALLRWIRQFADATATKQNKGGEASAS